MCHGARRGVAEKEPETFGEDLKPGLGVHGARQVNLALAAGLDANPLEPRLREDRANHFEFLVPALSGNLVLNDDRTRDKADNPASRDRPENDQDRERSPGRRTPRRDRLEIGGGPDRGLFTEGIPREGRPEHDDTTDGRARDEPLGQAEPETDSHRTEAGVVTCSEDGPVIVGRADAHD